MHSNKKIYICHNRTAHCNYWGCEYMPFDMSKILIFPLKYSFIPQKKLYSMKICEIFFTVLNILSLVCTPIFPEIQGFRH